MRSYTKIENSWRRVVSYCWFCFILEKWIQFRHVKFDMSLWCEFRIWNEFGIPYRINMEFSVSEIDSIGINKVIFGNYEIYPFQNRSQKDIHKM